MINCTISEINNINVTNGFEFSGSNDSFYILYSVLRIDNFLQANTKIEGHPNIIKMGNMSEIEYSSSSSSFYVIIGLILGGLLSIGAILSLLFMCL